MTVSGLTITRAWRQPGHRQDRVTQKTLSAFRSNGRGLFRFRTATCCRRARISVWSAARSAKISMILCMPERVSGGDAKFQGFCDGWNKWEGQAPDWFSAAVNAQVSGQSRTTPCKCPGAAADPADQSGQPSLGRTSDPWGTAQAQDRRVPIDHRHTWCEGKKTRLKTG